MWCRPLLFTRHLRWGVQCSDLCHGVPPRRIMGDLHLQTLCSRGTIQRRFGHSIGQGMFSRVASSYFLCHGFCPVFPVFLAVWLACPSLAWSLEGTPLPSFLLSAISRPMRPCLPPPESHLSLLFHHNHVAQNSDERRLSPHFVMLEACWFPRAAVANYHKLKFILSYFWK